MTVRKKEVLIEVLILLAVIALIIAGGRFERGYFAVASEPFVLAVGAFIIWAKHKTN